MPFLTLYYKGYLHVFEKKKVNHIGEELGEIMNIKECNTVG